AGGSRQDRIEVRQVRVEDVLVVEVDEGVREGRGGEYHEAAAGRAAAAPAADDVAHVERHAEGPLRGGDPVRVVPRLGLRLVRAERRTDVRAAPDAGQRVA